MIEGEIRARENKDCCIQEKGINSSQKVSNRIIIIYLAAQQNMIDTLKVKLPYLLFDFQKRYQDGEFTIFLVHKLSDANKDSDIPVIKKCHGFRDLPLLFHDTIMNDKENGFFEQILMSDLINEITIESNWCEEVHPSLYRTLNVLTISDESFKKDSRDFIKFIKETTENVFNDMFQLVVTESDTNLTTNEIFDNLLDELQLMIDHNTSTIDTTIIDKLDSFNCEPKHINTIINEVISSFVNNDVCSLRERLEKIYKQLKIIDEFAELNFS